MRTTTMRGMTIAVSCFLGGILLLLLLPIGPSRLLAALECLPLGWWFFLVRNLQQVTVNWTLILSGVLCSMLVVGLSHFLLGSLARQMKRLGPEAQPWRWRWTLGIYAGVWLMFLIAFGAAGVFRHTTWLLRDSTPWFEDRPYLYADLRWADGALTTLLLENENDLASSRQALAAEKALRNGNELLLDEFNIILFGDRSNKVAAYVILPREARLLNAGRFCVCRAGTNDYARPLSRLKDTIAELDRTYPERD